MKIKSYNLLFRIFSYLSDKTNGAPFFVKYKLMIGTLIIGLTSVSCGKAKQAVTCYDMQPVEADSVQITCYESMEIKIDDTIEQNGSSPAIRPETQGDSIPFVSCYDTVFIDSTERQPDKKMSKNQ
ncbi:MAG: hypothetical protein E6767_02295 [Dysgonomonas sp.]|nr:hypothetical protein [Dysgonomonas sp.]